jgi:hypothetical protein
MAGELISTEELVRILHEPNLRIFDCTTRLDYQSPGTDVPYIPVPGLDTFEAAHIPGGGGGPGPAPKFTRELGTEQCLPGCVVSPTQLSERVGIERRDGSETPNACPLARARHASRPPSRIKSRN